MTAHAFVDESKARGFVLAAALVLPEDLAQARKQVNALKLPGQRRVHFATESPSRRRAIIGALVNVQVSVRIYDATAFHDDREARRASLARLVSDLARLSARMLIIEQDDSLIEADRRLLYAQVRDAGCLETLRYEHKRAHEECLLAIPDAVAWCWAKGGGWRDRTRALVAETVAV